MLSSFSTPKSSARMRSSFMIGRKWEARPNELTTLNLADGSELHFSTTPPEIVSFYKTKVHRLVTLGFPGYRVLAKAPRNHMLLNGVPLPVITQYPGKQHSVSLQDSEYPQIRDKGQTPSLLLCVLFGVDLSQGLTMKSGLGFTMRLPACLSLSGVGLKVCAIMPCLRSKSRNTIINHRNHNNLT